MPDCSLDIQRVNCSSLDNILNTNIDSNDKGIT